MTQPTRTLDELINRDDPGMALVREWVAESERTVAILPVDVDAGERTLLALQVTTRSILGAIAYETGGIVVDDGWLRILGASSPELPRSIDGWNRLKEGPENHRLPGGLLIADDALGGFFAINGGGLNGQPRNICYLPPDTCDWEDLEMGHTDWVQWVLAGDLPGFYESLRWPGWQAEVAKLSSNEGISIFPPLWAKDESGRERSRRAVPIEELWGLHAIEYPRQLGTFPES